MYNIITEIYTHNIITHLNICNYYNIAFNAIILIRNCSVSNASHHVKYSIGVTRENEVTSHRVRLGKTRSHVELPSTDFGQRYIVSADLTGVVFHRYAQLFNSNSARFPSLNWSNARILKVF